jgi:CBS domain-containing protein
METPMRIIGPGKRLRIYIGESDRWQGGALYMALLETLKREGLAGATVTRGLAGFGAHSRIHTAAIERLSSDLPLVLEVVERAEQIDQALALVAPMVREGLITLEDVQIVKYTHRELHPLPADRPVRAVMTREVVSVTPTTPLADVMDLLIGRLFTAVPVVDEGGHVLGIVSDGDLMERGGLPQRMGVTERLDQTTLTAQLAEMRRAGRLARDVMSSPALTIRDEAALAHAVSLMVERQVKRLPVVDGQARLVGMLSRLDVLKTVVEAQPGTAAHAPAGLGQSVGEVMHSEVPTVPVEAELGDIVAQMVQADLKRVIVVDAAGRAVGSINDGDLVARVRSEARPALLRLLGRHTQAEPLPALRADAMMTPGVLSGPAQTPVAEALRQMLAQRRKRFLVVDEAGRPLGLVDRQLLLHALSGVV